MIMTHAFDSLLFAPGAAPVGLGRAKPRDRRAPSRRGRVSEARDRRASRDRRGLRPRPRPRRPRVSALAACWNPECRDADGYPRIFLTMRPRFQCRRTPDGWTINPDVPAYCRDRCRQRAAHLRRGAPVDAVVGGICDECGRDILPRNASRRGGRVRYRAGRPRRFCGRDCRQKAYRRDHPVSIVPLPPTTCRGCGAAIPRAHGPGRPRVVCDDCRAKVPTSATSIAIVRDGAPVELGRADVYLGDGTEPLATEGDARELEDPRRRAAEDPEPRDWLRRRGVRP